jgi:RND family efflux transporter MFP subunit
MELRILSALPIALWLGCGTAHRSRRSDAVPPSPRAVVVAPAEEVTQPVGDEVVGTLRARSVAALSSSVTGTVRTLKVRLGSKVRAGDALIQLSAAEIDAKVNQAKATFTQAEIELKRAQQLKTSQSIPASQYELARAQFQVAEATLAEAEVMRGYTVIKAPFDGVVTAKQCEVGDLALPGKPLLVLESPGALRLEAAVPEAIASYLKLGQAMLVRVDALQRDLPAVVSELSPSADPVSRTLLVKLDLPKEPELRPGMFGRLVVRTGEERVVSVPSGAIVQRGQMELVFVVDHQQARLRLVRSGRSRDGRTEILAGLDAGEAVVSSHAEQLVDAQPVEVRP